MKKKVLIKKIKKVSKKAVPLWLLFVLLLNASMLTGFLEYYWMKKSFSKTIVELSKTTKNPQDLVLILKQEVLPQKGYKLSVKWGDIGRQLISAGIIDEEKYKELFKDEPQKDMQYLTHTSLDRMVINERNSRFMVNTLWALGLVNKSKILDEGSMREYSDGNIMGFSSTGGWTLGTQNTSVLYSSQEIIKLPPQQEELVKRIAQTVYRPCCGNHTEFPDCNHGMAALGYIELAVRQGVPERQIYKDLLALNSFWFPQNYLELSIYMYENGTEWKNIDAELALSSKYSSGQGAQVIRESIQNIPGLNIQSGGCSA